jgi:hypothetical protein
MSQYEPIIHWKTGEICYGQSSYECVVLLWLNENKIDYRWQIPIVTTLLTPNGKFSSYVVDLQILSGQFEGRFIEIKGTWNRTGDREYSQRKWKWLLSNHPNSLLWMRSDLVSLNIMTKSRLKEVRKRSQG